jgi:hypothetical protein
LRREVDWHFATLGHRVVEGVKMDVLSSCEYAEGGDKLQLVLPYLEKRFRFSGG